MKLGVTCIVHSIPEGLFGYCAPVGQIPVKRKLMHQIKISIANMHQNFPAFLSHYLVRRRHSGFKRLFLLNKDKQFQKSHWGTNGSSYLYNICPNSLPGITVA